MSLKMKEVDVATWWFGQGKPEEGCGMALPRL